MTDQLDHSSALDTSAATPAQVSSGSDLLRRHLAERDEACPSCGYNLRGLTGDTCPECRLKLLLGVQLSSPRTGRIIAALMGSMASGAPAAAIVLIFFVMVLHYGTWPNVREFFWIVGVPAIVALLMVPTTIFLAGARGRKWFRRLSDHKADVVIFLTWAASIVSGIIYTIGLIKGIR